ncbi:MAG: autotransporter domain-containing protein, partial [Deltaproteobacteria bacterium]|nr:autotransporter domain-containing protein [Deltaproteobacteria bacterium]
GNNSVIVNWNQGEISLEGDYAVGIDIDGGQKAENWNSILVNGTGGVGVLARGSGNNIRNIGGTIEATGSGGIAVSLGVDGGSGNRLENTNTITGSAGSGPAVSFEFSAADDGLDPNVVDNSGFIEAVGGTALRGSDGVEELNNVGTITGDVDLRGGDDSVFHVGTIAGDIDLGDGNDSFAHGGTITGDADLGGGDDSFTHAGTITGDVDLGPGQDRFILYPVGSSTGAVHGGGDSDTFVLGGFATGAFDLSIPSVAMTGFEALEIDTTETWTVSGSGVFQQGTTVVQGTLDLEGGVSLQGDYTQGAGTSLAVHLTSDDRLTVQDADIAIESGATLVLTSSEQLPEAFDYTILDATAGSLTGRFEFVEYPSNSGPWPLVLDYSQSRLSLGRVTYASLAITSNGVVVGGYLDDLALAADPAFAPLFDALPGPQPGSSYDDEYLELSPESYDAHTSAALSWGRSFTSVLRRRPLRCESHVYQGLPDVRSESPCGEKGWMPWAEPLGQYGKRDGGVNYLSYDRLGAGLAVGADKRLDERWTVSAGLAAGRIGIDFGGLGNGTLTSFDLAAAGSLLLGPAHVRAALSYGHGWHTSRRDIDLLGVRATGDHDSNRVGLLVEAGYEFELGPLRIEPLVEFDYTYIAETKLAEEGAGVESLQVDERSNSQVATSAGLRISGSYYKYAYLGSWFEWLDGVITPELSARWRRVWIGDDRDVEARMVGAPAEVGSFEVAADDASAGLEIGTRVIFQPQWTRNTVELGYDVFIGNNNTLHNLGLKLRIPF